MVLTFPTKLWFTCKNILRNLFLPKLPFFSYSRKFFWNFYKNWKNFRAKEIATGLIFLHEKNIVHRDLALRNVLYIEDPNSASKYTLKISDFGLARSVVQEDYYKSENQVMPSKRSFGVAWILTICEKLNGVLLKFWNFPSIRLNRIFGVSELCYGNCFLMDLNHIWEWAM